jgi:transcription initiation factor TFIIIB Brf1 subunit/transcription initiation factor TFIIB
MYDGDDFDPILIAEVFQKTLFANLDTDDECKHTDTQLALDGDAFCVTCGMLVDGITIKECSHTNISKDDSGVNVCSDCGMEFDLLDFSREWRNFGISSNRTNSDLSRCHKQKTTPKGVKSVFDTHEIELSQALIELVDAKFNEVLKANQNKVFRGQGREAIIAACLFHAYQSIGENRTSCYVRQLFGINQKNMTAAMRRYYIAFPDDTINHMTPERLIPWIMKLTGVGQEHCPNILAISKYLSATSQLVERSNPQSVAAATVYFYLCLFPEYKKSLGLTKTEFASKAKLSDITISKIVKDMAVISEIAAEDWKVTTEKPDIQIKRKRVGRPPKNTPDADANPKPVRCTKKKTIK